MPTVLGRMYAEAREPLRNFNVLNVLILGDASSRGLNEFLDQLLVLNVYIADKYNSAVKINLFATEAFDAATGVNYGFTLSDNEVNEGNLIDAVKKADIDIVFDQDGIISKRYAQENFYIFQTVKTIAELTESCEDFLVGNDVPWLFSDIAWNLPLMMRYFHRPGLPMGYFAFMGECRTSKGYTDDQEERVRYIANRLGQIEYTKDLIQAHIKRMRKTERNGYTHQDFNFELNNHVGNYYFLIAGVFDSMARLMNEVLKLGLTRHDLALEKEKFIKAHRRKRTGYVRMLTNKEFVNWVSFLKDRRNFIAHDGDMRQSPLVVPKLTPLTDAEVDALVDQQTDWTYAAMVLTPTQVSAMRAQAAAMVRIQNDYKTVAKNVMLVPDGRGGHKGYQPLRSIDHDYDQTTKILTKILERLKA